MVCKNWAGFILSAILRGVLRGVWALDFVHAEGLWDYNGKRTQRNRYYALGLGLATFNSTTV